MRVHTTCIVHSNVSYPECRKHELIIMTLEQLIHGIHVVDEAVGAVGGAQLTGIIEDRTVAMATNASIVGSSISSNGCGQP